MKILKPKIILYIMDLLKTGCCTIILGENYYKEYFSPKKGKLLKVTKILKRHNDINVLHKIRQIKNYSDYYAIQDESAYLLNPSNNFYKYLQEIIKDINIFNGTLQCYYIDNAGETDLYDTINELFKNNYSFWKSYKIILNFSKKIMEGLSYLHSNKICHLDIKPENIVIDKYKKTFKIIDFGFSSCEPFSDYLADIRGTPGYFPKEFKNENPFSELPPIKANDLVFIDGQIPMVKDISLVYKIDSYCFGRTLYLLEKYYDKNILCYCTNEKKHCIKLNNVINCLVDNDVYTRLTIKECLQKYFN